MRKALGIRGASAIEGYGPIVLARAGRLSWYQTLVQRKDERLQHTTVFAPAGDAKLVKKPLVYGLRASQLAARQLSKLVYPLDGSVVCCEEGRIKVRAGE